VDWVGVSPFPVLIIATYFFKESVNKSFKRVRNAVAALNAFVQEHITGMLVVQAFAAEKREFEKFKKIDQIVYMSDTDIKRNLERWVENIVNSSIDMEKSEIVYKRYFNIGIAVDTDRGLLVPVIRDVDKKNITQISADLATVSKKARDKKLSLDDMQGASITISNLGGIGGTYFTPIINAPEVAIIGVSKSAIEPVYLEGELKPRLMMPLSMSYDHRIIDGADAVRFLRWVINALENPFLLSLEG